MTLYLVFKQGKYFQQCGGVFESYNHALRIAMKLKKGERDDYHNYIVKPFILNNPVQQIEYINEDNGGDLIDSETMYKIGNNFSD